MDCRQDRDWFFGDINARKDSSRFRDTGKPFVKDLRRKMAQLEVKMIFLRSNTTAFANLNGHAAGDDITRREILRGRGVTFHEPFTFGVQQVTSFPSRTYSTSLDLLHEMY
jgi:hypothetical protein